MNTKFRVAVIYGNLPPHVRIQQAQLFNDINSPYDVLVATDAIGYGLNLNIRRVIFSTMSKFDGYQERLLEPAQTKQIAGRAGRFQSRYPEGEVTAFRDNDVRLIKSAFSKEIPAIESAGLKPSAEQIELFARKLPENTRFSELLSRFEDYTTIDEKYFMCSFETQKELANLIQNVPLGFSERFTFCQAPVSTDSALAMSIMLQYAITHANGSKVPVMVPIPEGTPKTLDQLKDLEDKYKILDVYSWLSYRFPVTFSRREEAEAMKQKCKVMIEDALKNRTLSKFEMDQYEKEARYGQQQRRDTRRQGRDKQQEKRMNKKRELIDRKRSEVIQKLRNAGIIGN